MSNWRLAESLKILRRQIDERFPNRSKASDGTIGDVAHSARKSDHNPNQKNVVQAADITHDLKNGVNCHELLKSLLDGKDARIKYIIFSGRIYKARTNFLGEIYRGANQHIKHLHLSVSDDARFYDNKAEWSI